MSQWRSTEYEERARGEVSPEEHFGRDANQIVRTYELPAGWTARAQAIRNFLGDNVTIPGSNDGTGAFISRITPHPYLGNNYPLAAASYFIPPGVNGASAAPMPFLWAASCPGQKGIGTRGEDTSTGTNLYQDARLAVEYTSRKYAIPSINFEQDTLGQTGSDLWMIENGYFRLSNQGQTIPDEAFLTRYVTIRGEPAVESFNYPTGFFLYGQGYQKGNVVPQTLSAFQPKANIVLIWEEVPRDAIPSTLYNPSIPLSDMNAQGQPISYHAMEYLQGAVNGQEYDYNGKAINTFGVYPPGTLLFTAPEIDIWVSGVGRMCVTVTYHLSYFPFGACNVQYAMTQAVNTSFDATLTANTNIVISTQSAVTKNLTVGQVIQGEGIPPGTTLTDNNNPQLALSNDATIGGSQTLTALGNGYGYAYGQIFSVPPSTGVGTIWPICAPNDTTLSGSYPAIYAPAAPVPDGTLLYPVRQLHALFRPPW